MKLETLNHNILKDCEELNNDFTQIKESLTEKQKK